MRTLGTVFQVNEARPALVTYRVSISNVGVSNEGAIELRSDAANPPTTVIASCVSGLVGPGVTGGFTVFTLTALIFPGHNVRLFSIATAGAPVFAIQGSTETIL